MPGPHNVATSCITAHGNATFQTNAAGFANLAFMPAYGTLSVHNSATHSDTVLGDNAISLASGLLPAYKCGRIVSAGIRVRSTASFSTDSGIMQSYFSI